MINERFNRWLVICYSHNIKGNLYYYCICDCGKERLVREEKLRNETSKSCGCLAKEMASERASTHSMSKSPEYHSWQSMKSRVTNSNVPNYKNYGGRGITICERWLNSFESFYDDMGPRPKGTSLDRIDVNKGYFAKNCRWADKHVQGCNRQDTNHNTHSGVRNSGKKFVAMIYIDSKNTYLGTFDTAEQAARSYDDKCEDLGGVRINNTIRKYE